MTLLSRIRSWIGRLLTRGPWVFASSEDIPDQPRPRRVYLVGEPDAPWAVAFLCPCDCGELVRLSLLRDDDPSWVASGVAGDKASIHPSIWRIRGCKSHFFITEGAVVWAKEERPDHRVVTSTT